MSYILVTPTVGTALSVKNVVLTAGVHYLLVDESDIEIRNGLTLNKLEAVPDFKVDKPVNRYELSKLVVELQQSKPKQDDESYEDYRRNLYLFAVEALTSEQDPSEVNPEANLEPKTTTSKKRSSKTETAETNQTAE